MKIAPSLPPSIPGPLTLTQAQELAWLRQNPAPATSREALGRLLATTRACVEAFDSEQLVTAQNTLEEVLLQTLIAMKTLDLQPDMALKRALKRTEGERAFHIYADRVEIRAQGEVRGAWPLYAQADYEAALNVARELGCNVIHEETCQLGLFHHAKSHPPAEAACQSVAAG